MITALRALALTIIFGTAPLGTGLGLLQLASHPDADALQCLTNGWTWGCAIGLIFGTMVAVSCLAAGAGS